MEENDFDVKEYHELLKTEAELKDSRNDNCYEFGMRGMTE